MMAPADPMMGGAPPMGEPPMPGEEGIPPAPATESLDYDAMKSLAIESGCDHELIKLLEDMKRVKNILTKEPLNKGPK
jgi:hypothetical protein